MFVDPTVPTKHEDITVITFRFSDIVEESCHTGMALSSGTLSMITVEHLFFEHFHHKYARPLCIFQCIHKLLHRLVILIMTSSPKPVRHINRNRCRVREHYFPLIFLTGDQQNHKWDWIIHFGFVKLF